ncbi:MAG: hypothetical protein IJ524_05905 [Bacteroidales bacterium]|nr:hypothetical protein [Bacteroidales bacterium]
MKRIALIAATLLLAASATATADDGKPPSTGLSFFANAGAFWASNNTANFYNGHPSNANTIDRVLHSSTYGTQIWQHLVNQGAISPSTIGSYNQLQVVEYADMYYRISYQIGLGLRYDYTSGFGWLLRFDLTRLNAIGAFNLSSDNGASILGNDPYIRCGILGKEERISIDFALAKTARLSSTLDLEINLGASLINTKVQDNLIEVGGATYSILDVWDGQSPDYGVGSYEYINQGGIGYGVFISVLLGYSIPSVGAIKAGYTCYQSKTVLKGGTGTDGTVDPYTAWGWQHMLGIRFEINNFSFIK